MTKEECLKSKIVLYVEDDIETSKILSRLLERIFGEVLIAYNGKEAFEIFLQKRPDVVVTDIEMPLMNGLELLHKIKEINPTEPVVILTGFEDEANNADEANAILIKPVSRDELKMVLFELCIE